MAIRRNPTFRFDYFLRSLPIDLLARRCEQLMKGAEKEVEQLERKARELAGLPIEPMDDNDNLPSIELPKFRVLQRHRRIGASLQAENDKKELEKQVAEIEDQIRLLQSKLKAINEGSVKIYHDAEDISSTQIKARDISENDEDLRAEHYDAAMARPNDAPAGAHGPKGKFVEFPQYDGIEHPGEWKKPFTLFCHQKRKDVKLQLDHAERKDKVSFVAFDMSCKHVSLTYSFRNAAESEQSP
jgi:SLIDE